MTNFNDIKRTMQKSPATIWVLCRVVITLCRVGLRRAPLRF